MRSRVDVLHVRRRSGRGRGRGTWVTLLVALAVLACGLEQQIGGQVDYVQRAGPAWFVIAGGLLAVAAWGLRAYAGVARAVCIAATVFLLPSAVLSLFHVLRLLGAIPLPADGMAMLTSVLAVASIALLWWAVSPLRNATGGPLRTPRWLAVLGLVFAMAYPALKTYWALGGRWSAPAGVGAGFDADYLAPVGFAVLGAVATVVAFRWWDRPAPRFAHPAAVLGGLTLTGLGVGGSYATARTPDQAGPLVGVLVYGGWLVWGLTTLAVAARLSARTREDGPTPDDGPSA